jgi:hypothetical protein
LKFGVADTSPTRQAHQAAQVLEQIAPMHFELDEFLRSPEARRRLAFAQWCREHSRS